LTTTHPWSSSVESFFYVQNCFQANGHPSANRALRRYDCTAIIDEIDRYLSEEPERTSKTSIKRLRGHQDATFRLRVGAYRIFYDVRDDRVEVIQILHKSETGKFYKEHDL
jgi:mRNA-degrading endonuclease RelE of RelBE toxin-antitoxin system